jgi:hypothetical protein
MGRLAFNSPFACFIIRGAELRIKVSGKRGRAGPCKFRQRLMRLATGRRVLPIDSFAWDRCRFIIALSE